LHDAAHALRRALDAAAFERALSRWTTGAADARGWTAVAIDGKTLCGSTDVQLPGVHLLNRTARMRTFCCDPVKTIEAVRQN